MLLQKKASGTADGHNYQIKGRVPISAFTHSCILFTFFPSLSEELLVGRERVKTKKRQNTYEDVSQTDIKSYETWAQRFT